MLILALDCSTARGTMALAVGSGWEDLHVRLARGVSRRTRSRRGVVHDAGTRVGRNAAGRRAQLKEIVVGLGPGSYSGVRQAIAAATGLAMATGARLPGGPRRRRW